MAGERVLFFDTGLNLGDNLRGFGVLKAFREKHPEVESACWLSPHIEAWIGVLLRSSRAVDRIICCPRSPRETYRINHELIKYIKQKNKTWLWSSFPGGKGPDQQEYTHIVPTGEPWFSAKLLNQERLHDPERINQGLFLAKLLETEEEKVRAAQPLLGTRNGVERYVTVGLCRPDPNDPKQLPRSRRELIWEVLLDSGLDLVAVDKQDHAPPPRSSRVRDLRAGSLEQKVAVFNRAALHVGSDGGLIHFAAACGCPTVGFYAGPGPDPGRIFGPWPEKGTGGNHVYADSFDLYLEQIEKRTDLI